MDQTATQSGLVVREQLLHNSDNNMYTRSGTPQRYSRGEAARILPTTSSPSALPNSSGAPTRRPQCSRPRKCSQTISICPGHERSPRLREQASPPSLPRPQLPEVLGVERTRSTSSLANQTAPRELLRSPRAPPAPLPIETWTCQAPACGPQAPAITSRRDKLRSRERSPSAGCRARLRSNHHSGSSSAPLPACPDG